MRSRRISESQIANSIGVSPPCSMAMAMVACTFELPIRFPFGLQAGRLLSVENEIFKCKEHVFKDSVPPEPTILYVH